MVITDSNNINNGGEQQEQFLDISIPIVHEQFIYDSIEDNSLRDISDYLLAHNNNCSIPDLIKLQNEAEWKQNMNAHTENCADLVSVAQPRPKICSSHRDEQLFTKQFSLLSSVQKPDEKLQLRFLFCNVTFVVGEWKFPAVAGLCAFRCKYFADCIQKAAESRKRLSDAHVNIEIDNVQPEVFRHIMDFTTQAKCPSLTNLTEALLVYEYAHVIEFESAKHYVLRFIERSIAPELSNLKDTATITKLYDRLSLISIPDESDPINQLLADIGKIACSDITSILESTDFYRLSRRTLQLLVSNGHTDCGEDLIFRQTCFWGIDKLLELDNNTYNILDKNNGEAMHDQSLLISHDGSRCVFFHHEQHTGYLLDKSRAVIIGKFDLNALRSQIESVLDDIRFELLTTEFTKRIQAMKLNYDFFSKQRDITNRELRTLESISTGTTITSEDYSYLFHALKRNEEEIVKEQHSVHEQKIIDQILSSALQKKK